MAWIWEFTSRTDDRVVRLDYVGDTKERCAALGEEVRQRAMKLPPHPAYGYSTRQAYQGVLSRMPDRPLEFQIKYYEPPLRKVFGCGWGTAINNEVRDAIEALEPGVHQYIPILLTHQSGEPVSEEFWVLNIGHRLDTCSPEHSLNMVEEFSEVTNPEVMSADGCNVISWYTTGRPQVGGPEIWRDLCLFAQKRAGKHLWYEYKMMKRIISDELFEAWSAIGAVRFENDGMDSVHPVREI